MRIPWKEYLSELSMGGVHASRENVQLALEFAKSAEKLGLEINIGDIPFLIEGAANVPKDLMLPETIDIEGEGFLEIDKGNLVVNLKRRVKGVSFLQSASPFKVKMRLKRTSALESVEQARERAIEVVREQKEWHRAETQRKQEELENGPAD